MLSSKEYQMRVRPCIDGGAHCLDFSNEISDKAAFENLKDKKIREKFSYAIYLFFQDVKRQAVYGEKDLGVNSKSPLIRGVLGEVLKRSPDASFGAENIYIVLDWFVQKEDGTYSSGREK
jgi:hypothetical protein